MTPWELQGEVVVRTGASTRWPRGLGHLGRLRFAHLLDHLWGWWFISHWAREHANRDYLRGLAERSQRHPQAEKESRSLARLAGRSSSGSSTALALREAP